MRPASASCRARPRGGGVAEEQQLGLLVVDEVAARRGQRLRPAGGDGLAVAGVLDDAHAALAQAVFLPFLGVGGHVHHGVKAQRRHDADAHAQVAGAAHGHGVLAEQRAGLWRRQQAAVGVGVGQQAVLQRDGLCKGQHFMKTATGLDGAGHGQFVITLEIPAAGRRRAAQLLLQGLRGHQAGLDLPGRIRQLGKQPGQQRRAARQALLRVVDPIQGRRVVGQRAAPAGLSHSSGVRD